MSKENFDLLGRIVSMLATIPQAWGVLVDLCEKLASPAGQEWQTELAKFLRREPAWPRRWRVGEDGIIYVTVISRGRTGEQWIEHFKQKGTYTGDNTKSILLSPDFKPTSGVKYEVAILPGCLFENNERLTQNIREKAECRKLSTPNAELACLIRDTFADKEIKEIGFHWIITMHEPINDSVGRPLFLGTARDGGSCLDVYYGGPGYCWVSGYGFAFVSQVSS